MQRLAVGLVGLRLGDVPCHDHRLQHFCATVQRGALVDERVVFRRRLRQAGQQRRLRQRQLPHRLVEEHLRGRLDAVRGLAADGSVRDVVEVVGEDPVLGVHPLQLLGELGLDDLVLEIMVGPQVLGQVDVVDELHGQRRGALQAVPAVDGVLDRRSDDPLVVERSVLVEAAVLDRDRRLLEPARDLRPLDRGADRRRPDVAERLAVGREHLRRRPRDLRLERLQVRRRMRDVDHPARDCQAADRERAHREHDPQAEYSEDRGSVIAPAASLSFASAHVSRRGNRASLASEAVRADPGPVEPV